MAETLSYQDTKNHTSVQYGESFTCGYCNFSADSTINLKEHLQNDHNDGTAHQKNNLICEFCIKSYS